MKLSFEILSNFAILLEYENSNRISILSNIGFLIADALVYVNTRVAQTERKKNKKLPTIWVCLFQIYGKF